METKHIRWLSLLVGLTFSLTLADWTPLAAQNSCQAVNDAKDKVMTVPAHIYNEMAPVSNNGVKPGPNDIHRAETIYIGTSAFTKLRGKWQRSQWTAQRVIKQDQENRRTGNFRCEYLGDEAVNGERAAVYSTRSERDKVKSDGQIWISKSRGLPLRHEFDIEMTSGATSKNHVTTRYEYSNVRAPM
jgi:hypothetical protein